MHVNSEWLASNASTQATPAGSGGAPTRRRPGRKHVGEEGERVVVAARRLRGEAVVGEVGAIERREQGLPFALTGRGGKTQPGLGRPVQRVQAMVLLVGRRVALPA